MVGQDLYKALFIKNKDHMFSMKTLLDSLVVGS